MSFRASCSKLVLRLFLGLLAIQAIVGPRQLEAQEGGRAAVVIRYGDARSESRCVAFEGSEISGYELLQRSGLAVDVKSESQGGLVCAIEGTGCGVDNCLCECKGDPCVYWSYWQAGDEGWSYSPIGATVRQLSDGEVDGWSWGPGSVTSAIEPRAVSFEEVCTAEATVYGGMSTEPAVEQPIAWQPYLAFGLLVVALGGGAWIVGRRRSKA